MTPLEENYNGSSGAAHVFLPHGIVDALPQAACDSLTKHLHLDSFLHSSLAVLWYSHQQGVSFSITAVSEHV